MQDQRILYDDDDNDDVEDGYSSKPARRREELDVVDPSAFSRENEDGWKMQNVYRIIKRIMIRELSKTDVMPDERAKMVNKAKTMRVLSHLLTTYKCLLGYKWYDISSCKVLLRTKELKSMASRIHDN